MNSLTQRLANTREWPHTLLQLSYNQASRSFILGSKISNIFDTIIEYEITQHSFLLLHELFKSTALTALLTRDKKRKGFLLKKIYYIRYCMFLGNNLVIVRVKKESVASTKKKDSFQKRFTIGYFMFLDSNLVTRKG